MKLISFRADGIASWGLVEGDTVVDLGARAPSLRAALGDLPALTADTAGLPRRALDAVTFLPPIPDPDKIICVGLNYLTHILEGGREPPKQPTIFTRWANTQIGHGQPMIRPNASATLDFEGELAVVIGRTARHVAPENAESVIAGYSCYNDGSVRGVAAAQLAVRTRQELPRHRRLRPVPGHAGRRRRHQPPPAWSPG